MSRTIYVNVDSPNDSPNLGFPYFNFVRIVSSTFELQGRSFGRSPKLKVQSFDFLASKIQTLIHFGKSKSRSKIKSHILRQKWKAWKAGGLKSNFQLQYLDHLPSDQPDPPARGGGVEAWQEVEPSRV